MTIREIKRDVDPHLIETLEETLAEAKRGEINGVVILIETPTQTGSRLAGKVDIAYAMKAFEELKFKALFALMTDED